MICDGEKAIGIAGIMGGENSMITDDVKTILFEAACFDGTNIRLSSKRIGLRTDASGKFEKGLDPNNAMAAMDRACQLIEELGAGEVVGGMPLMFTARSERACNVFHSKQRRSTAFLEQTFPKKNAWIFQKSNLDMMKKQTKSIAPTFRQDIHRMADLAEEVARFYGYDNIPTHFHRRSYNR